jgi:hypothetical protein
MSNPDSRTLSAAATVHSPCELSAATLNADVKIRGLRDPLADDDPARQASSPRGGCRSFAFDASKTSPMLRDETIRFYWNSGWSQSNT